MIWISYFLHFYITFNCFGFTTDLSISVALVAFVVGSIAVIVPTPNGAGPWHFAVKTILVLNGVGEDDAVTFALIVHTIQTSLTALLGVYAILALQGRKSGKKSKNKQDNPLTNNDMEIYELEPQNVWRNFYSLTQIPRPSGHTEKWHSSW